MNEATRETLKQTLYDHKRVLEDLKCAVKRDERYLNRAKERYEEYSKKVDEIEADLING